MNGLRSWVCTCGIRREIKCPQCKVVEEQAEFKFATIAEDEAMWEKYRLRKDGK